MSWQTVENETVMESIWGKLWACHFCRDSTYICTPISVCSSRIYKTNKRRDSMHNVVFIKNFSDWKLKISAAHTLRFVRLIGRQISLSTFNKADNNKTSHWLWDLHYYTQRTPCINRIGNIIVLLCYLCDGRVRVGSRWCSS